MANGLDAVAIDTLKALAMDAVEAARSGHPGTPMALAPLGHLLFTEFLAHDPARPDWANRDRFVLSCGHASMLLYGLLHLHGYDLSLEDIKAFRQWGSKTPGHPEFGHTPGVETTTGPLGQGIANAIGMALAERHLAARFNRPGHRIVDHRVWVIASDGDLMEGVSAEAASLAGHLKLNKLVIFWDDNRITIDGRTDLSFTEDVLMRYRAYGFATLEVEDGANLQELRAAAEAAVGIEDRPVLIRVRTIIGDPAPKKRDTAAAHGAPLGKDEVLATKTIMGWPLEPFHIPAEVKAIAPRSRQRGAEMRSSWEEAFFAYESAYPDLAAEFKAVLSGALPADWDAKLPDFAPSEKGLATRVSSHQVLNAIAQKLPHFVGGSADLTGSNGSWQDGQPTFQETGIPRNLHFGVREHGMGSIANGMALHGGVMPYCATFLIFSDYMRPAIRLAALMRLKVRYIFTHDSIGLGEDGPTHQPIEQLATLRAIPGLLTFRPADAAEVREAWRVAIPHDGPVAFALTRQNLPTLDRNQLGSAASVARGAYVLREATGNARLILIGTGSEVHLCLQAAQVLEAKGVPTRVVSMPCPELFAAQDQAYRDAVLPPAVPHRIAVEAGISQGWHRFVGSQGRTLCLDHFGASAPAEVLFERFGFTVQNLVAMADELLGAG